MELYVLLLICMSMYGNSTVILLLLLILVINFSWMLFILLEVALVPLIIYTMSGGGYERNSASLWMVVIGYIVGVLIVCGWGISSSLFLIMFLFAKVPVYGLHGWLPKLHVESSLFGSMVLAGVVLNFALVPLYWIIGLSVLPVVILSALNILNSVDGNWLIAISSVVHMTAGVVLLNYTVYLIWGGVAHFVVSPILFYIVYVGYNISGSRYLIGGNSVVTLVLLLMNLGFPLLSSFYMELPLMMTTFGVVIFTINGMWFLKLRTSTTLVNWEYMLIFVVVMFIL